jgi:hypothetical protein
MIAPKRITPKTSVPINLLRIIRTLIGIFACCTTLPVILSIVAIPFGGGLDPMKLGFAFASLVWSAGAWALFYFLRFVINAMHASRYNTLLLKHPAKL